LIIFLTEKSRYPASRFFPFASLKEKHRSGSSKAKKQEAVPVFSSLGHVIEDVGTRIEVNNEVTLYIPTFETYQFELDNIVNIV